MNKTKYKIKPIVNNFDFSDLWREWVCGLYKLKLVDQNEI